MAHHSLLIQFYTMFPIADCPQGYLVKAEKDAGKVSMPSICMALSNYG